MLHVVPIKTEIFQVGGSLENFLSTHLQGYDLEGKIIAVTSKIVSLSENCLVSQSSLDKKTLVHQEADHYLGEGAYDCHLTIKENMLIPSAGIDESNSQSGQFITYPKDPFQSAKRIHGFLKTHFKLNSVGVILTDSHTTPLRQGVTGIALSFYGFKGVIDKVGTKDLFGREIKMTQINLADGLAVSATLTMGEGNESCPLALLDYPVEYMELPHNNEIKIPVENDIYFPLISQRINTKRY